MRTTYSPYDPYDPLVRRDPLLIGRSEHEDDLIDAFKKSGPHREFSLVSGLSDYLGSPAVVFIRAVRTRS